MDPDNLNLNEEISRNEQAQRVAQVLAEVADWRKESAEAEVPWINRFNNFETNSVLYSHPREVIDDRGKIGRSQKTIADYRADLLNAVAETGVDFESAIKIHEEGTNIARMHSEALFAEQRAETDSERAELAQHADSLAQKLIDLQSGEKFLEIMLPVYAVLRAKGYSHADLAGFGS